MIFGPKNDGTYLVEFSTAAERVAGNLDTGHGAIVETHRGRFSTEPALLFVRCERIYVDAAPGHCRDRGSRRFDHDGGDSDACRNAPGARQGVHRRTDPSH